MGIDNSVYVSKAFKYVGYRIENLKKIRLLSLVHIAYRQPVVFMFLERVFVGFLFFNR